MRTVFALFVLLATSVAHAQEAVRPEVDLGNQQMLVPGDGPGWKLVDKATGKERALILPAFHPEYSVPVVQGNRLAYVGRTQRSGKFQLGCITYDLVKGKVLNRQVSELYAREGQIIDHPRLVEGESAVTCRIAGDRCTGKELEHCSPAAETITLDFEPGSLARKDLKGAGKVSAKGKAGKKSGSKAVKGATQKTKGAAKTAAKPTSRKAAHR